MRIQVANACLEKGGKVVGVIPNFLADREVVHLGVTELIRTESMHERKLAMHEVCIALFIRG